MTNHLRHREKRAAALDIEVDRNGDATNQGEDQDCKSVQGHGSLVGMLGPGGPMDRLNGVPVRIHSELEPGYASDTRICRIPPGNHVEGPWQPVVRVLSDSVEDASLSRNDGGPGLRAAPPVRNDQFSILPMSGRRPGQPSIRRSMQDTSNRAPARCPTPASSLVEIHSVGSLGESGRMPSLLDCWTPFPVAFPRYPGKTRLSGASRTSPTPRTERGSRGCRLRGGP